MSKMMMVNHSLEELDMGWNKIGDDGITAIAGALSDCKIYMLDVQHCGITLIGARSLAEALSSNHIIRILGLKDNPITVEGALLIIKSAIHNTEFPHVIISNEHENDEVKKMMDILEDRRRQEVSYCAV